MNNNSNSKINFIYNAIYQLLLIFLPLITTPFLSRVLGAEKIGLYSYNYAISYYFVIFIMLGLNNYGTRAIASVKDDKRKLSKIFCEIYSMQLIISAIIITIYLIYCIFFSNSIMSWIMLIYVISGMFDLNWFYFGLEEFKLTVIRNAIIKIITTLLIFIFIRKPDDIYLYAILSTTGLLVSQLVLLCFLKKYIDVVKVSLKDVIKHVKPNLLLFIPVIAISIYKMMDKIMLGSMSTLNQVGYYENVDKIILVPIALINSLGTVMLPRITHLISKNNTKKALIYFDKSIIFAIYVSSLLCFGIMAVSNIFVPLYYGKGFESCIELFYILMPSCLFLAIANVVRTQYLIPYNYDRIYITSVILGALINLIINIILIPKYNSKGAAIGTLIAEFIVCFSQILLLRKSINIMYYLKKSIIYIFCGIIMFVILMLIPNIFNNIFLNLFLKVIIGLLLYFILTYKFIIVYLKK